MTLGARIDWNITCTEGNIRIMTVFIENKISFDHMTQRP